MKTGLGIFKALQNVLISKRFYHFFILKMFFGFDVANSYTRYLDKKTLLKVLIKNKATIGENCDIENGLTFHNCKDYSNLTIGDNCHIGKNCFFDLRDRVVIKDNVVVSMQTTFITHQDLNKSDLKAFYPSTSSQITIKSNCYIGANVTILMGVVINENSVIAAGAVVNVDVPAYSVYGGVPVKFIKNLYTP